VEEIFSSNRVAELLGISAKSVYRWANAGLINGVEIGRAHGVILGFRPYDILAVAVARDLRARGFELSLCRNACNWLRERSLADLQAEWNIGRNLLLIVGAEPPFPRQWSHDELFDNDQVDLAGAFSVGVPVAILNLEEAHRQILAKLHARQEATA
jgi:DNA-binding transcriptional MerR regulator